MLVNSYFTLLPQMCRDPKLFKSFGKAWYAKNPTFKSYPSFPKTLLKSTGFETVSAPALELYDKFISKLQNYLGATVSNFSVTAQWNESGIKNTSVLTFFNQARYCKFCLLHCYAKCFGTVRRTRPSLRTINGRLWAASFSLTTKPRMVVVSHTLTRPFCIAGSMVSLRVLRTTHKRSRTGRRWRPGRRATSCPRIRSPARRPFSCIRE